jgi:hypothetical protein
MPKHRGATGIIGRLTRELNLFRIVTAFAIAQALAAAASAY